MVITLDSTIYIYMYIIIFQCTDLLSDLFPKKGV